MEANRLSTKDLMVGDWVMINPISYYQVGQIRMEFDELRICLKGTEVFATENDIMPVPLTPEILEKNGMHLYNRKTNSLMEESRHYDCFEEDEDYRVELSLDYDGKIRWTINGDEYTIIPLDYVHQLQNALRLCGIEKEITL